MARLTQEIINTLKDACATYEDAVVTKNGLVNAKNRLTNLLLTYATQLVNAYDDASEDVELIVNDLDDMNEALEARLLSMNGELAEARRTISELENKIADLEYRLDEPDKLG